MLSVATRLRTSCVTDCRDVLAKRLLAWRVNRAMRPKTHTWLCAFPDTARHWIGQRVYNLRMPEYTIDKCPSVYHRQMSEHHDGLELLEQETEPSTRQKRRPQEKRYVSKFSVSIDNRQYLRRLEKPPMKFRRGDAKETRTMTAAWLLHLCVAHRNVTKPAL